MGVKRGSMMGIGNYYDDNLVRVVGNGTNTYFWLDPWLNGAFMF